MSDWDERGPGEGHEPLSGEGREPLSGDGHEAGSDDNPAGEDYDPGANTEMFRAFAERQEPEVARPRATGVAFRLWTLLVGLVVFVGLAWLLFRG